jgi:uncharacterized protein YdhG (YjbR/CyaY superfamily)
MDDGKGGPGTIDEYIAGCAPELQERLEGMRKVIREAAPEATEKISYQMPTFYQGGNLIHFAAFKGHIGLYPTPHGVAAFEKELAGYKTAKGSIQFPHDRPIPWDLVRRITAYRVAENAQKAGVKKGTGRRT